MQDNTPKISIGLPVFNGGKIIKRAIESILAQTFKDFELIISDNASTDDTEIICREYAANDERIRYIRQSVNRGADFNFQFVLSAAKGEYFMWVAHDDIRSQDFLLINFSFLSKNPDYVASVSPVCFDNGKFDEIRMGDATLAGEIPQRVIGFFKGSHPMFFKGGHANGRFYSLIRRNVIKDYNIGDEFMGNDWALTLYLISKGKLNRSIDGWIILGSSGRSNNGEILRAYTKKWVDFLFPYSRLTLYTIKLCKTFPIKERINIIWDLFNMNATIFVWNFIGIFRDFYKDIGL